MKFDFNLQLFGGGGGGSSTEIKSSAPGSTSAATIDNATAGQRQETRDKLAKAFNRAATNKTGNQQMATTTASNDVVGQVRKALLGE